MNSIKERLAAGPTWSVEFFPPRTPEGHAALERTLEELEPLDLSFVSVTYGAGGTTAGATRDVVVDICARRSFPAMAHLTCMGHRRDQLEELLEDYRASGVNNILALAGDPPADGSPATGEFSFASELVELVRAAGPFDVGVAAHPECHPRSRDRSSDRRHLAAKLELADFGITQFFFEADDYFRMVDELAALGCSTPVLPGIMPLMNPDAVRRFAAMSGATFPEELASRILEASPDDRLAIAVEAATSLCAELLERGVPGLHVYCLNRSEATTAIFQALS